MKECNPEDALSHEAHMPNHACNVIEEMRNDFMIEDEGPIRRVQMFEDQRYEYAINLEAFRSHGS